MKKIAMFAIIVLVLVGGTIVINSFIKDMKNWSYFNNRMRNSAKAQAALTEETVWADLVCYKSGQLQVTKTFYVPKNMTSQAWQSQGTNHPVWIPLYDIWGFEIPLNCKMNLKNANGEVIGSRYTAVNGNGQPVSVFNYTVP